MGVEAVLVIVDMQNEYVDIKGKSYVNGAENLEYGILKRISDYEKQNTPILYTINTIVSEEYSNQSEVKWAMEPYNKLKGALEKHKLIEKTRYAITAENAVKIRDKIVKYSNIESIEFVGVETNICILANGLVFQNLFPDAKIIINSKLCTSSSKILHSKALDIMSELKMEVI